LLRSKPLFIHQFLLNRAVFGRHSFDESGGPHLRDCAGDFVWI
jgi:hypothetical protein